MIKKTCTELDWIAAVSRNLGNADKILVEKVIRAMFLLEGLAMSDLNFCFKGGTATMLLLGSSRRMSIDIDIIAPDSDFDMGAMLTILCERQGFIRWESNSRQARGQLPKEHYKLFYQSAVLNREQSILLDVLHEKVHYVSTIEHPIDCNFIENEGEPVSVTVPDINNIAGDKLTAFAPNTIGVPYIKGDNERGMEIIKQMYDLSCLFEHIDNIADVRQVFDKFCEVESRYRGHAFTPKEVLSDAQKNALSIAIRKAFDGTCEYDVLSRGIKQVGGHIFSEKFNNETAICHGAKVAYLAELVKHGDGTIEHFDPSVDMRAWSITRPADTRLNKVKKYSPEAFFYLYKMYQLMTE